MLSLLKFSDPVCLYFLLICDSERYQLLAARLNNIIRDELYRSYLLGRLSQDGLNIRLFDSILLARIHFRDPLVFIELGL